MNQRKNYRNHINKTSGETAEKGERQRKSKPFQLNRNAAFVRSISEVIPIMILAKEAESGRFVFWNKRTEEITGIEAPEAIGKTVFDIFPEQQALVFQQGDREVLEKKQSLEFPAIELNSLTRGKRVMRMMKIPIFLDRKDPLIVVFAEDVTGQYEAEQEAERQRDMTRVVLDSVDHPMAVLDPQGVVVAANEAWLKFGQDCAVMAESAMEPGTDYLHACQWILSKSFAAAEIEQAMKNLSAVLAGRQRKFTLEYECGSAEKTRYYMMNVSPLRHARHPGAVVSHIEITEHKKAETVLRENHDRMEQLAGRRTAELQLFENIISSALEGITVTDAKGMITNVNDAFTSITGFSREEALGNNPRMLRSDRHSADFYRSMWQSLKQQGHWEGEIWNRRANGEVYPEWLTINAIKDGAEAVVNYVAVFHDISQIKEKDKEIEQLIYLDPLTGLPNRALMHDRLEVALEHARRAESSVAIFYLNLDNFNNINDSLGHPVGDDLLCAIADHLQTWLRDGDTVAHVGGDEFIVISPFDQSPAVSHLAERLHGSFEKPFSIDKHEFYVTCSIGIATFPEDGASAHKLIQNATLALHQAKKMGKNCYRYFDKALNTRLMERLAIEQELRDALKLQEFPIYYQPQISMESGRIIGLEALIRWRKADGTLVPPDQFIPVAEEMGLIHELGIYVLERACQNLQHLHTEGFTDLAVAVNLSAVQFEKQSLARDIISVLERNHFNPAFLELEITETIMMSDIKITEMILNELARAGIRLSVDDFGTGYSSLYYLKRFPINALKIDRSFVRDLLLDGNDRAIISAVLTMAEALKIETVAEGIETMEQHDFLRQHRCDKGQGYLYSQPLPFDDLMVLLQAESTSVLADQGNLGGAMFGPFS